MRASFVKIEIGLSRSQTIASMAAGKRFDVPIEGELETLLCLRPGFDLQSRWRESPLAKLAP